MTKVFIDGSAGTTGLRIHERLKSRSDITLITLPESERKNINARKQALNEADIVFLCLPDTAAKEAVGMVENSNTAIIDTSTAHRTLNGWTYGFAEISNKYSEIRNSKRIANPGCHATGFIALVAPLVEKGIISKDAYLSCFSLTGYSGGGKKMIAEYESVERSKLLDAPRMYGLNQNHKHLPEMAKMCSLKNTPLFCPIVAPYFSGMQVTVPLTQNITDCSVEGLKAVYRNYYKSGLVTLCENDSEDGFLSANAFSGKDSLGINVYGDKEKILLVSRFDNLGKGASGAAIQNMNILLGTDETVGLEI